LKTQSSLLVEMERKRRKSCRFSTFILFLLVQSFFFRANV